MKFNPLLGASLKIKTFLLFSVILLFISCGKQTKIMIQDIDFPAEDGVMLKGTLYLSMDTRQTLPAVALGHQYMSDRKSWDSFAVKLCEKGFVVLAFDFRGWGESQGARNIGEIDRDMLGAVKYLSNFSRVDRNKIGAAGASMGGMAAVLAAAQTQVVKAVAAVSSPPSWQGLEPAKAVAALQPRPLLVITADLDAGLDVASAKEIFDNAGEPKQWIILNTDKHGTEIFDTSEKHKLEEALLAFFTSNLK